MIGVPRHRPAKDAVMRITIPIRTVSELNQREHWAQTARRAKAQRSEVYYALRAAWCLPPQTPYAVYGGIQVTLTRNCACRTGPGEPGGETVVD